MEDSEFALVIGNFCWKMMGFDHACKNETDWRRLKNQTHLDEEKPEFKLFKYFMVCRLQE